MKLVVAAMFAVLSLVFECAHAQSSREQLLQLAADLRRNPSNYVVRERILRLAPEVKPLPATPEEAERRMARGAAAMRLAKSPKDFTEAVAEFESAVLAAPWVAAAYYNLALAKDGAGDHAGALRDLKLYLASSPNDSDARQARALVYDIEYRQERQEKDSREAQAKAAAEQARQTSFVGARYAITHQFSDGPETITFEIGSDLVTSRTSTNPIRHTYKLQGTRFWMPYPSPEECLEDYGTKNCGRSGTINENEIVLEMMADARRVEYRGWFARLARYARIPRVR